MGERLPIVYRGSPRRDCTQSAPSAHQSSEIKAGQCPRGQTVAWARTDCQKQACHVENGEVVRWLPRQAVALLRLHFGDTSNRTPELMKQPGVASVTVYYEKKELIVSFDDAKTTPDAFMKSTAAVGFPSQIAR